MTWTANRIVLISRGRHDEAPSTADCYPGMLLTNNATISGNEPQVLPHNILGGGGPWMVCEEDALQGLDITQKVPSGQVTPFRRPAKGDLLYMLLANGQNVVANTPLMSNGDGTLVAAPGQGGGQTLYQIVAASSGITNVTAETVFSNGTYTIPANFLQAGDVLHIRGRAVVSAQNSTNTHDVKLEMLAAHTIVADSGAVALAATQYVIFDVYATIRSVGASGSMVVSGLVTTNPGGTVSSIPVSVAATTIDTTVAENIRATSTASAASAGNVIALQEFQVDLMRDFTSGIVVYSQEAINNSGGAGSSPVSGFSSAAFIRCMVP